MGYLNLNGVLLGTTALGGKKEHIHSHNDRSIVMLYILSLDLPLISLLKTNIKKNIKLLVFWLTC